MKTEQNSSLALMVNELFAQPVPYGEDKVDEKTQPLLDLLVASGYMSPSEAWDCYAEFFTDTRVICFVWLTDTDVIRSVQVSSTGQVNRF
jgi:hypothetical protein